MPGFDLEDVAVGGVVVITSARVLQNVTANASILNAGNLAYARLPIGSGSWDVGAGNTLTLTRVVAFADHTRYARNKGAMNNVTGALVWYIDINDNMVIGPRLSVADVAMFGNATAGSGATATPGETVVPINKSYGSLRSDGSFQSLIKLNSNNQAQLAGGYGSGVTLGIPMFAAAGLPAGAADFNGWITFDITNNRFVAYANGARYHAAATAF